MHLVTLLGLVASSALAVSLSQITCNSEPPETLRVKALEMKELEDSFQASTTDNAPIVVPTWFHVVYVNETESGGLVPQDQLDTQFEKLNSDWAPHGISFDLLGTTYTHNPTWSRAGHGEVFEMKQALRRGGYDTLNIYITMTAEEIAARGFCPFPGNFTAGSVGFVEDGCVVYAKSLPGSTGPPWDPVPERWALGSTMAHEVGHWLGLWHTMVQNGPFPFTCDAEDNDFVDDTPVHLSIVIPGQGIDMTCPAMGRDTCPELPGRDPLDNIMSYQYDSCVHRFTSGQGVRARSMWREFRAGRK